ncbi:CBS domain-containing protein [Sinorhizobium sp. BG8]|uniref:CBS domain-containing protein n=1 Tax=Sinorhizobium sp. BG8 TaxID=2613773 RepID=UPI00193E11E3|nr:CBS domain-containing protein [Sinorhizobium sp. BG8]QRM57392.1 CBS domain-containing protein [Sinorhizobium sp. BG8]
MQIAEIMTRNVHLARPENTLHEAAVMMADHDIGFLPVADESGLVGTITDRDIVVRAIAPGRDGETLVGDTMSTSVTYCFSDEQVEDVVRHMGALQVRRLAVLDRHNRLAGVVSLADAARAAPDAAGSGLKEIVEPTEGATYRPLP